MGEASLIWLKIQDLLRRKGEGKSARKRRQVNHVTRRRGKYY
jgi:hypothetical protein